jgi:hypothetical protein
VLFVLGYVVPGGVYVAVAERVLASALLIVGVLHTRAWLRWRRDPEDPDVLQDIERRHDHDR